MDIDIVVSDRAKPCVAVNRYSNVIDNGGACSRAFDRVVESRRPEASDSSEFVKPAASGMNRIRATVIPVDRERGIFVLTVCVRGETC